MTITRQRLNQILKEEVHRELQEQKLLQEKMNISREVYEKIISTIVNDAMASGGSRKLYRFYKDASRVIDPWEASISATTDTDYGAVAKNLTSGRRGEILRLNLMALVYGFIKDLSKETYVDFDVEPETIEKDKAVWQKSALKVGREPEKFLSGLGRLGTKIGIGKSKLAEIRAFCSYLARIYLFLDPDNIGDEIKAHVSQNAQKKQQSERERDREAKRLAIAVLKRLLQDSEVAARRMIAADKAFDEKTKNDLLDRPLRKTGIFDKYYKEDEEFYNLIKNYATDGRLIAKILGTDADKEGYLQ